MTDQQIKFVDAFVSLRKGAPAARRAGYDPDYAKQIAYELLQNEEIKKAIAERFAAATMSANEAAKHLSDIAATRLNSYFKVRQVQGRQMEEHYVTVLLAQAREQIQTIRDFMDGEGMDKKARKPFLRDITKLQKQCLDYTAEIARYGNEVTRLVPGKPVVTETVELDMVAVAKAKDVGRIQEYSNGPRGTKIKMYAADAAAKSILEFHGKMVQKHEHTFPDLDKLTPDQLEQLSRLQQAIQDK